MGLLCFRLGKQFKLAPPPFTTGGLNWLKYLPSSKANAVKPSDVNIWREADYGSLFAATMGGYFMYFHRDLSGSAQYMHVLDVSWQMGSIAICGIKPKIAGPEDMVPGATDRPQHLPIPEVVSAECQAPVP